MQQRLLRYVPNALTLFAGAAALCGVALLASAPIVALGLLLLGQVLDCLDGYAARRLNAASEFGARLDWSLDVAVVHVVLVQMGLVWLVPAFAILQADSLTRRRRISGRSAIVGATALHLLGAL